MEEKVAATTRRAWINREEKIISFHYVEGYEEEVIADKDEIFRFMQWYGALGYEFQ